MTTEIIIAGFGGQGILFAGKVLAYCALIKKYEISWLPSYGPEMRGGTANCSVCISDEPIGSPVIVNPDCFIAMNQPSYQKFINTVKPNGLVLIDSSTITENAPRKDVNIISIPASDLAAECELNGMANMILLGKMIAETRLFSVSEIEQALRKCIPEKRAKLILPNITAVNYGTNYSKNYNFINSPQSINI